MRKSVAMLLALVFLTASCITVTLPVNASSRTIVVPDDYSTIQDAIKTANEGDTIFVKKGTYKWDENQTLVINKAISLIGENADNTKIILHPPWVATGGFHLSGTSVEPDYAYANPIEIRASNVTLSGFTIASDPAQRMRVIGNRTQITYNIITTGLSLEGSFQNITKNTLTRNIDCYRTYNITIAGNSIIGGAIVVGYGSTGYSNMIYGNTVTKSNGIHLLGNGNRVFNNTIENCSSGVGVVGADASNNVLYANRVINNDVGLVVSTEGANNVFYANHVANNTVGVSIRYVFPVGDNNTFYHNNFVGNTQQVQYWDRGYDAAYFDNGKEGNYWSDYDGTDNNNDGIGDVPYMIYAPHLADPYRKDRYPLIAPFDIENGSIMNTEPFPITLAVVSIATVAVIGLGLLVYFKKRER